MITKTYFDVFAATVAKHPVDVLRLEYRGNAALAAGSFWQVHDSAQAYGALVPANGAVPVKAWPATVGGEGFKEFSAGELHLLNGLYVAMSTTEATLTLGTGTNKFAMLQIELVEPDAFAGSGGGTATGPTAQVGWNESGGPKRLLRVKATNLEAGIRYLQLFAHDTIIAGNVPLRTWTMQATGDSAGRDVLDLRFGDGLWVKDKGLTAAAAIRQGCSLILSTTPTVYTACVGSGMSAMAESI